MGQLLGRGVQRLQRRHREATRVAERDGHRTALETSAGTSFRSLPCVGQHLTMKTASTSTTKESGSNMSGMPNVLVIAGIT